MSVQEALSASLRLPAPEASPSAYRLQGRWLAAARAAWLLLAAYGLVVFGVSIGPYFEHLSTVCIEGTMAGATGCPVYAPSPAGAATLAVWGVPLSLYAGYFVALDIITAVVFVLPGAFMLRYRSDTLIGFLISLTLLCFGFFLIPEMIWAYIETYPTHTPLFSIVFAAVTAAFVPLFFLFPDGRFVPRWSAVFALLMFVTMSGTSMAAIAAPSLYDAWERWQSPVLLVAIAAALYSQVVRYRRVSTAEERRQTKWGLLGIAAMAAGAALWGFLFMSLSVPDGQPEIALNVLGVAVCYLFAFGFVICLAIAVFRYRLWNINVIVNTTLVYGSLTALVVALYVLVVGALGTLFQTQGNLAIALLATGLVAVLLQPLRARLQRAVNRLTYGERDDPYTVLARLGKQLQTTALPQETLQSMVETIATALKLPYVAIELVEQEQAIGGASVGIPVAETVSLPLRYQNEVVGQLVLSPRSPGETFSAQEHQLLEDIAGQAGALTAAVRLTVALQRSRERIVLAREEERRRIRRDLHDELGPTLASQTFRFDAALDLLEHSPQEVAGVLQKLKAQNQATVADIRRLVYELRPPALDELGLAGGFRAHAAQMDAARARLRVIIEAHPETLPALPAAVEVAAYRIVLEAINNTVRHARATTCRVVLTLRTTGPQPRLLVEVEDDGAGLPHPLTAGIGLSSMRERAEELGGTCRFTRGAAGGARVCAELPIAPETT